MDDYRRSGFDRRLESSMQDSDRRSGQDRREVFQHQDVVISKLKNTPFFQEFTELS